MKALIVGGACQGKGDYAQATYGPPVTNKLHLAVRERMRRGEDAGGILDQLAAQDSWTVVCDEIGGGVVPLDPFDREWREAVGRLCCILAKEADVVERVVCGIPIRMKG